VVITAGRDRIVLAMLLLHADRVVSSTELIQAVWGDDPPPTARGQLQTCVSRLRRALPAGAVVTDPAGYRLRCGAQELDAAQFAQLVADARARRDAGSLRQALDLWRGPALVEFESTPVRRAAAVLDELRAVATEDWADLELAAGNERELLGELAGLVEQFPLRERLRGQLMMALYRAGRQADALAEYRRASQVLRDELGIEPKPELTELHRRILNGGDDLTAAPASRRTPPLVRCLPRTIADFTGREAVLARLVGAVERDAAHGPVVLALDGMAGSGKTTLALHLAGLVGDRFPDAHLFVDLHGHSDQHPLDPAAALLILLRQLGVEAERVPPGLPERAALWRSELAGRRALVILDNAASSEQVADLVPAGAGALAVVTSRRRMIGLDGVRPESLPVFTTAEAGTLLARIAGDRVSGEPGEVAELVRRCGSLPLALRLAGARLAHRPRWRVADLLRRMSAGNRTLSGTFAFSLQHLAEPARDVFRLLGVYPGRSFDALAVAALAALPLDDAEDLLDELVDVHLVEEPEPGVFRLHDLLGEYAAELAAGLPAERRRAAVTGALDFELHAAVAAAPGRASVVANDLGRDPPQRPDLLAALTDPEARLERNRPSLAALLDAALDAGRPDLAWQLPRAAWRFLWSRGYIDDIAAVFRTARDAAQRAGDHAAEGMALNYLASAYYVRGRYDQARTLLEDCIRLREAAGDKVGLSVTMANLASIYCMQGRYVQAAEVAGRAMRLTPRDNGFYPSSCLDAFSLACSYLGRHAEAIHAERRRLLAAVEAKDAVDTAHALMHVYRLRVRAGVIAPAHAERGLRLVLRQMTRHQFGSGEIDARLEIGDLLRGVRRYDEALAELTAALDQARRRGDIRLEAVVVNTLARTLLESGDPAAAAGHHRSALDLAERTSLLYEQARAHLGLGDCLAQADPPAARAHWDTARDVFTRLQVPDRADAEKRLGGEDQLHAAAGGETMVR
jgi:DNA-binding SARP family transcriptional activator/tetratricopeptide (TPR) repeat protein